MTRTDGTCSLQTRVSPVQVHSPLSCNRTASAKQGTSRRFTMNPGVSFRETRGMQLGGTLLSTDCGFNSGSRSYLTGHRGLPQHFAEVQQGIKRLLACCRNCDDLWKKMTTSATGNVDVVSEISFGSFLPPSSSFTSTSFIMGTGLKKWRPPNLSNLLVALAMSVMGSEDVLLANIVRLQTHCAWELFDKNSACWNKN